MAGDPTGLGRPLISDLFAREDVYQLESEFEEPLDSVNLFKSLCGVEGVQVVVPLTTFVAEDVFFAAEHVAFLLDEFIEGFDEAFGIE